MGSKQAIQVGKKKNMPTYSEAYCMYIKRSTCHVCVTAHTRNASELYIDERITYTYLAYYMPALPQIFQRHCDDVAHLLVRVTKTKRILIHRISAK